MLNLRTISRICLQRWRTIDSSSIPTVANRTSIQSARHFHPEFTNNKSKPTEENVDYESSPAGLKSKYNLFKDEDSEEIFDVEEEKRKYREQETLEVPDTRYQGLNLDRKYLCHSMEILFREIFLDGVSGVFDIKDLVHVLLKENAKDIFVCKVPEEYKYVDYMVVVTGMVFEFVVNKLAINYIHLVNILKNLKKSN